jgi:hypothetical protein
MAQIGYRGVYNKKSKRPYRISRSKIELFIECPRCFWLETVKSIKRPNTPPFLINSAIDQLLKTEFDSYRKTGEQHPWQVEFNVKAKPYSHEMLDEWRENFVGIQVEHQTSNLVIFGAIDDVWENDDGELVVVDYKATAKTKEIKDLDPSGWHDVYRRQMEVYQWLLRQQGFSVSDTGYFVYANGIATNEGFFNKVEFRTNIFPYKGNSDWVEEKIGEVKNCLDQDQMPPVGQACAYCPYVSQRLQLTWEHLKSSQSKKQ